MLVLALFLTVPLAAQDGSGSAPPIVARDSVTVAANPAYGGGTMKRLFLGSDYRDLWTTPIHVPVLDLEHFAGGLTPLRRGGLRQTRSLRFLGADGREYTFRSVDKYPVVAETPDLRGTLAARVIEDQTSALLPAAALAVPPLLEAVGVLHVVPQLAVLPDDPRLGEFREEFAGLLGMIEERPNEGEEGESTFAGAKRIIGSDRLQERIRESPRDRVDSHAFLTARLLDAFLNDWDRHWGQWRWAEFEREGTRFWVPIPLDRDYVFTNYNGLAMWAARQVAPHVLTFSDEYEDLRTLTFNSFMLDRQLLSELSWPVWDSIATSVETRLTDAVISEAIGRFPEPYQRQIGAELERILRIRRAGLRDYARHWYWWLSSEVDVHGTDTRELAYLDYQPDGGVEVRLYHVEEGDPMEAVPYFQRRFLHGETSEVRLYLYGGDDRAVVRGSGPRNSVVVRVVGGESNDVLVDSSSVRGGSRVAFYDAEGEANRFVIRPGTVVDKRPFAPPTNRVLLADWRYRDFGSTRGATGLLDYGGTPGIVVGAGMSWTDYGFRQVPYAYHISVLGSYSFRLNGVGLELFADRRLSNSRWGSSVRAEASQIETFHFYGYGNDSRAEQHRDQYLVRQDRLLLSPGLEFYFAPGSRISFGPLLKYADRQPGAASPAPAAPYGSGRFGQLGGRAEALLDLRDSAELPRSGAFARFGGSAYAATWDAEEPFGEMHGTLSTYLSAPGPWGPTLTLRAGSKQVWGRTPVHEAAFLGGWGNLRGYENERFAGDAALWGSVELRSFLTRTNFLLVRGDLGALAFADAGRVYFEGESPGGWHSALGGGLYVLIRVEDQPVTASLLYARGDRNRFRVQLGVPF